MTQQPPEGPRNSEAFQRALEQLRTSLASTGDTGADAVPTALVGSEPTEIEQRGLGVPGPALKAAELAIYTGHSGLTSNGETSLHLLKGGKPDAKPPIPPRPPVRPNPWGPKGGRRQGLRSA